MLQQTFCLVRYRFNGRQRFITIGRHGLPWRPDTARAEDRRRLGLVAAHTDPAIERERQAEHSALRMAFQYRAFDLSVFKARRRFLPQIDNHSVLFVGRSATRGSLHPGVIEPVCSCGASHVQQELGEALAFWLSPPKADAFDSADKHLRLGRGIMQRKNHDRLKKFLSE